MSAAITAGSAPERRILHRPLSAGPAPQPVRSCDRPFVALTLSPHAVSDNAYSDHAFFE
jgi:hypothetical protein